MAGLRRLRELLPGDTDQRERHRYFVRMLHGFERDAFAIEVNRQCLMLADFPNPDGWRLDEVDVFRSKEFNTAVSKAGVVLCNPPFESFRPDERQRYRGLRSVQKPVELLHRVLEWMPEHALLGFVLPRVFVNGAGYAEVRKLLAQRFGRLEVVSLPDRVFRHSKLESALVLGSEPRDTGYETRVSFARVDDRDRESFMGALCCHLSGRGRPPLPPRCRQRAGGAAAAGAVGAPSVVPDARCRCRRAPGD